MIELAFSIVVFYKFAMIRCDLLNWSDELIAGEKKPPLSGFILSNRPDDKSA